MVDVIIHNVTKEFDRFRAVDRADIHIKKGEFFTFLGPSGCGKTTTLRMVAGFSYPTEGEILFNDKDVTYLPPNKRNIGMVFQNYALFPHLTIGENVAFGLKIRKLSPAEIQEKVARALTLVNLGGYERRRVNEISGGQQQRVALARALVIEPDILLLDEPLSNLDAKLRDDTRTEIKRLQMELGITTIYVTHDQAEAMAVSDRIMIMKDGRCQQIGTPLEIYTRPHNDFVATFIGKNSLIPATITALEETTLTAQTAEGLVLTGRRENMGPEATAQVGAAVTVAIRPEAFSLVPVGNRVTGVVRHAEFTGMTTNYLVEAGAQPLKASFLSLSASLKAPGEEITLFVPEELLYFL